MSTVVLADAERTELQALCIRVARNDVRILESEKGDD
jgi:hypothetical protein